MLTIDGLSKTYANGANALAGFTFACRPGDIVAIVGGSGCGKSTLLRLLAGLDTPTTGEARIDDIAITTPRPEVGIVFQEPRLLPWLSVAANVGFGLNGLAKPERDARIADALERVGLAGYGQRWPRELSGGQAQRVAIARALVPEPKVLLLDEPFSALDAFTRRSLHRHLLALWERTRPTMLIVTHDIDEAITLADRVLVMRPHPGRIAEVIAIELAQPRDRLSNGFERAHRAVHTALDATMTPEGMRASEPIGMWW